MAKTDIFQFSIENISEIVIIFNNDGVIEYANRAARQQLEYEDGLIGCPISDVFHGGFTSATVLSKLLSEADGEARNRMLYRKNNTCFPVRSRIMEYHEEQSPESQDCYICMASDVSNVHFLEKKASQADIEMEEAQKIKTEFVTNVTHELRTPVNGILGNTQELLAMETEREKKKLLLLVERGCKDMNTLINNILDFSKLEAGKFTLESRKFHFRNMFDYIQGSHSSRIIEKGLEFSVQISPEIPEYIIGDELRLVQVLNNLISNAYKFTNVGEIHVEAVKTAQVGNRIELFFMVIDSGIGISKPDQDKLFKSFSQVDASISRKYGGTGLGLNICKQLVELMGGNIYVQSEVGKGTVFSFHIWVELPEEAEEAAELLPDASVFSEQNLLNKLQSLTEQAVGDEMWQYGEAKNKEEIEKKFSRLILSIEMENWEKAESFAETIRILVENAPREVKSAALRLKMSVQKADYEKAMAATELFSKAMEESQNGE